VKTRYLTAICLALSVLAAAHVQTGNGFPTLRYRGLKNDFLCKAASQAVWL
jgi:hypothetical protein